MWPDAIGDIFFSCANPFLLPDASYFLRTLERMAEL